MKHYRLSASPLTPLQWARGTWFWFSLWLAFSLPIQAITYEWEDSTRVADLLQEARLHAEGKNIVLYFAHQFKGIPYVGHTLEVNKEEELVVNLRQLDCTTFVETATALALTFQHDGLGWDDYLQWLQTIRYNKGRLDGYCSRNHYFSQWIASNVQLGLVEEQTGTGSPNHYPFTATQRLLLNYMSTHPESYAMLKDYPERLKKIAQLEKEMSGKTVRYIPASLLNESEKTLKYVKDGDILALVTNKSGLDVSHVGFAEWGKDGKLHLLNASSIHKKVVLEPMTLYQYIQKHPSVLGVRVIRMI
ncbi:MAG: DUF1460 domain-containing protein [Bacteroidaceae bacterium]|nr:DUF1460 domain-containing protein [Bacteroidaceae bacterium]